MPSRPVIAGTLLSAAILTGCSQCSNPISSPTQPNNPPGSGPSASVSGSASDIAAALEVTEPKTGTGAVADDGKTVSILYKGLFVDGRAFDERADKANPLTFKLGAHTVIAGLDAGLKGMRVGGRRRVVVPAAMAYGAQGFGTTIPPDTTLVFEVELIKVE